MSEDFNWSDADNSVVVRSYGDLAVYTNPHGDIVIRQQRYPDDDQVVIVPKPNVKDVIGAREREASAS